MVHSFKKLTGLIGTSNLGKQAVQMSQKDDQNSTIFIHLYVPKS